MTEPDEPDERPLPPREPTEGGSDRGGIGDAAAAGAFYGCDGCDFGNGCDFCDGCDGFPLLRVSLVLAMAALLVPPAAAGPVHAAIRLYQRVLTRFTPVCPATPSCSAYALAAVERLGARRGLAAAAARVRACGRKTTGGG